jgi:hypothetical protein
MIVPGEFGLPGMTVLPTNPDGVYLFEDLRRDDEIVFNDIVQLFKGL